MRCTSVLGKVKQVRISKKTQNEFEEYIKKNEEKFYRIGYSYTKNADDALDIVQEAVLKAMSSIETLKTPDYFNTWFYRILVNTALDFLRKKKRVFPAEEEFFSVNVEGRTDDYSDMDLQKVLGDLPENYKTIIILRFFEDLKIQEIAKILNLNENTVKTRLYKSLKILRIKLGDEEDINEL